MATIEVKFTVDESNTIIACCKRMLTKCKRLHEDRDTLSYDKQNTLDYMTQKAYNIKEHVQKSTDRQIGQISDDSVIVDFEFMDFVDILACCNVSLSEEKHKYLLAKQDGLNTTKYKNNIININRLKNKIKFTMGKA